MPMPVMDIGHVSMLMLSVRMFVFMGMHSINIIMLMKFIMAMSMFMQDRHMDVKVRVLFVCQ
jgi:hypothetical protein